MLTRSLFLASMFAFSACAGQTDVPGDDDASLADDAKADRTSGASSYYLIRPDLRRCAAPMCGGSFVKRVNFPTTTCVDGSTAAECYVAAEDYSKASLDDNDMSAVSGRPSSSRRRSPRPGSPRAPSARSRVGSVVGRRRRQRADAYATVSSTVWRVKDNGVRCITWPCASDRETKINGTTSRNVAGVDLSAVGATDDQISDAYTAMTSPDGALVDGSNGTSPARAAPCCSSRHQLLHQGRARGVDGRHGAVVRRHRRPHLPERAVLRSAAGERLRRRRPPRRLQGPGLRLLAGLPARLRLRRQDLQQRLHPRAGAGSAVTRRRLQLIPPASRALRPSQNDR